jgi:prepilin-type N-terminal cleavage/methylation domain-containing protein/prepilin-type processing-associated H-X9-DG protein
VKPGSNAGFTLLELLVVITIIAVLASMLIPAIGMVRLAAKKSNCQKRMHLIAAAALQYATDNDGFLPSSAERDKYHGYHFRPTETDSRANFGMVSLYRTGFINELMTPTCPAGAMRLATTTNGVGETTYCWRMTEKQAQYHISQPIRFALMADRFYGMLNKKPNHFGGLNVLYLDGSVQWLHDQPQGEWNVTSDPRTNGIGPSFGHDVTWTVQHFLDDEYGR